MRPRRSPFPLSLAARVTRQLKEQRVQRDFTQEELAEKLDVPVQHVSRIEAGQNISLETLERVAIALGLDVMIDFTISPEGPQKPPPSKKQRALAEKRRRAVSKGRSSRR